MTPEHNKLKKAVLYPGAEAVPGVKMLGMKSVAMKTSSVDEFAAVLDGSYFGDKFEAIQAYRYVKYAATMWMLSMARKYPDLKFIVMSPGKEFGFGYGRVKSYFPTFRKPSTKAAIKKFFHAMYGISLFQQRSSAEGIRLPHLHKPLVVTCKHILIQPEIVKWNIS